MPEDDISKLADWLAEYRRRPEPSQIVVATYDMVETVSDAPDNGMDAGRVALDIVRYDDAARPGPSNRSHYVMGVDATGRHLWDDWFESERAARHAIADGRYGQVAERPLHDN
jgi:hypothetical protein